MISNHLGLAALSNDKIENVENVFMFFLLVN